MSTLEYIISLLETMPEEKLKEIQNYIQYIIFRDDATIPFKQLSEEEIVKQLTESMKKVIWVQQHRLMWCHKE